MVKAAVRQELRVVVIREVVIMKAVIMEVVSRMEEVAGLDSHLAGCLVEVFLAGFRVLQTDFLGAEAFVGAEAFLEAEVFLAEAAFLEVVAAFLGARLVVAFRVLLEEDPLVEEIRQCLEEFRHGWEA